MSMRARMALMSVVATLAASCALLPLVETPGWLLLASVLLLVQSGVGAAARRVPLARSLTIAAQALVSLLLLTLAFAREYAVVGLVPGPQAFQHFSDLLQTGTNDVERYAIPAPLSDGIELMLVGGVLVIGLLVDVLAVTFRSAAPAGLPLLALYSVAAGLSDGSGGWVWFLIAAAGYLMLLLAEGRDRLSQWGRVFAGAPRAQGGGPGPGGAVAPVRTGRRIGVVALGIALVVPLALPAMDGGLLDSTGAGVGAGSGGGGTISAVNPLVSLRDSLNVDEDRTVLTLRTDAEDLSNMYLRIVSLDDFDGTTWRPSKRQIVGVPDEFPTPTGLSPDVPRTEVRTRIAAADWYAQDWLPMPYPPSGVNIDGEWRYEPEGMTLVGDHGQNTRGETYDVTSLNVQPTADQLSNAPAPPSQIERDYTELPDSLPPVVAQTAREVTAGASNPYEQAVRLQEYFAVSGGFTYDTEVEVGSGSTAIARFLRDKRGFCVHFSFAMASMARSLGIPARVAVGFAPGTMQADGSVAVGLRDAHAWPELYFEGVGWTRFEPTPNRGTTPSYTLPDLPGVTVPDLPESAQPSQDTPSAAPSTDPSCSAEDKRLEACAGALPDDTAAAGADGPPWYQIAAWVLLGLAVVAVPLAPMLWRVRRRSVRLTSERHALAALDELGRASAGGGSGADGPGPAIQVDSRHAAEIATTHVLAVWRELTDTAWDYGIAPDDALTPRKAAARIVRLGHVDDTAAASVHRVAGAVEQILYAPDPRPVPGLAQDVRGLQVALRSRASRKTRIRAVLAPRSAVRAVWDLTDRVTALRVHWAERVQALVRRPKPSGQQSG
ncbi:transglutaminaseTgpA domain-containing protein [Streptomyces sp. NPDC088387]|uniref:transglutaminaseTgpA domain-containing protein n=1 Tax=Streptomyces sp. NPDC088387 TaxID=3365859 RepID=UPI0037F7656F